MALTVAAVFGFGSDKTALATVSVSLYATDGTTVLAGPYSGATIKNMGSGDYGCEIVLPTGYVRGYAKGIPGDGSESVTFPINIVDLGISQIGAGDRTVTFTVEDDQGTPVVISGAAVTVKSGSTIIAWGTTDPTGVFITGLPDGSYTYTVTAGANYSQVVDAALTVNSDESVAVTLEVQTPTPPPAGGLCTVRFYMTLNRTAKAGYVCRARLLKPNQAMADELLSSVIEKDTTDGSGIAELILVREDQFAKGLGTYEITVTAPDGTVVYSVRTTIPNASTANAEDLIAS